MAGPRFSGEWLRLRIGVPTQEQSGVLLDYPLIRLIECPHQHITLTEVSAALVLNFRHTETATYGGVYSRLIVRHRLHVNATGTRTR
jgi:hypothetical protein